MYSSYHKAIKPSNSERIIQEETRGRTFMCTERYPHTHVSVFRSEATRSDKVQRDTFPFVAASFPVKSEALDLPCSRHRSKKKKIIIQNNRKLLVTRSERDIRYRGPLGSKSTTKCYHATRGGRPRGTPDGVHTLIEQPSIVDEETTIISGSLPGALDV